MKNDPTGSPVGSVILFLAESAGLLLADDRTNNHEDHEAQHQHAAGDHKDPPGEFLRLGLGIADRRLRGPGRRCAALPLDRLPSLCVTNGTIEIPLTVHFLGRLPCYDALTPCVGLLGCLRSANALLPVGDFIKVPIITKIVGMSHHGCQFIATIDADLCGGFRCLRTGNMRLYTGFLATNRTFKPVAIRIKPPIGIHGVLDRTNIATGIAVGVTGIVIHMIGIRLDFLTALAGIPMSHLVVSPFGLVVMGMAQSRLEHMITDSALLSRPFGGRVTGLMG